MKYALDGLKNTEVFLRGSTKVTQANLLIIADIITLNFWSETAMRKRPKAAPVLSHSSSHVRIISGQWRGRKLPVLDLNGLRPTTDRIKETVFNWLAMDIPNARCLDLFAGSGALGFEAASRYAKEVVLIEKDLKAQQQIKQNIERLNALNLQVFCADALGFLAQRNKDEQDFDLVFIDPPFRANLLTDSIKLLEDNQWLANNALIYVECEKEFQLTDIPPSWELLKEKQAGQVCYRLFIKRKSFDEMVN